MRACSRCGESYGSEASFCTKDGSPLAPAAAGTQLHGEQGQVLGSYRLLELIGEGGMGRVYLAEHQRLGRKVALKILKPELASNAQAVKRFFAEARAVNKLAHENVVEITDHFEGEAPDDPSFYIMELLRGQSLRELLQREGAQPVERVARIGAQLASALAAVHAVGIVHRDLKPENVFLIERGGIADFVKLLDFGIARHLDPEPDESLALTAAGAVVGTPEYMSPEQATGSGEVDHRADLYALGVILYELVSGAQPIKGKSFGETLVRQITFTPPPPGATLPGRLPPQLERLVMDCLEKDRALRPQAAQAIEQQLRALLPTAVHDAPALAAATGAEAGSGGTILDAAGAAIPTPRGAAVIEDAFAPTVVHAQAAPMPIPAAPSRKRRPLLGALLLLALLGVAAAGGSWWLLRGGAAAAAAAPAAAARPAAQPGAAKEAPAIQRQPADPTPVPAAAPAPAGTRQPRPTAKPPRPL